MKANDHSDYPDEFEDEFYNENDDRDMTGGSEADDPADIFDDGESVTYGNVSYRRSTERQGSVHRDSGNLDVSSASRDDGRGKAQFDRNNYASGVSKSRYGTGRSKSYSRKADSTGRNAAGTAAMDRPMQNKKNSNKSSRGRKRGGFPWKLLIILVIAALIAAYGYTLYQDRYGYSDAREDMTAYYGLTDDSAVAIISNDTQLDVYAKLIDGAYYMKYSDVCSLLNKRFYYGYTDNVVLYCLPTDMVRTTIDTTGWSSDESGTVTETYKPACMDGDSLYLALDFVRQYTDFSYETYTDPNRLVLHTADESKTSASVTKDTAIRTTGGVKSNIMKDLVQGDTVYILQEMTDWSEVESADGIIGYVENKFLGDKQNVTISVPQDYTEPEFTSAKLDGKVNMGWNNVISTDGNTSFDEVTQNTKALNVISPTWYPVSDDEGHIDSYATQDYVDRAHAMGLKVWPVVDNFNNTDIDSSKFLGTIETRSNVITSLMTEAETYGFDGINVDFEQIDVDYASDFIEFIRELSIQCRKRSLTLSVDNYVTYDFNDYYSMDEQAVFADYVVIMGYDEHYAGSSEAGSVASIDYVKYGIQRAMQEVPAEKIINGIPFYTRLWKTDSSGLSSEALSMSQAQDFIANHGAEVTWDSTTCQNVIDFTENDVHYQMWVEDSESISAKLDVMMADGIAGVAAWRLGFETADVWDVIEQYINGTLNRAQ